MEKTYILITEDYGVMYSIFNYSTQAKAMKALKAQMRKALKSCTMTAEEKREVRQSVDGKMAYDVDFDNHTQHAFIVEREVL